MGPYSAAERPGTVALKVRNSARMQRLQRLLYVAVAVSVKIVLRRVRKIPFVPGFEHIREQSCYVIDHFCHHMTLDFCTTIENNSSRYDGIHMTLYHFVQ